MWLPIPKTHGRGSAVVRESRWHGRDREDFDLDGTRGPQPRMLKCAWLIMETIKNGDVFGSRPTIYIVNTEDEEQKLCIHIYKKYLLSVCTVLRERERQTKLGIDHSG